MLPEECVLCVDVITQETDVPRRAPPGIRTPSRECVGMRKKYTV